MPPRAGWFVRPSSPRLAQPERHPRGRASLPGEAIAAYPSILDGLGPGRKGGIVSQDRGVVRPCRSLQRSDQLHVPATSPTPPVLRLGGLQRGRDRRRSGRSSRPGCSRCCRRKPPPQPCFPQGARTISSVGEPDRRDRRHPRSPRGRSPRVTSAASCRPRTSSTFCLEISAHPASPVVGSSVTVWPSRSSWRTSLCVMRLRSSRVRK